MEHGAKLIIYEDMLTGELLVMRDTGEEFEEEIVFKAPEWPEMGKEETSAYLKRELSKRRVVWLVTLKDADLAEEEYQTQLAAMEEDPSTGSGQWGEGGGMSMMLMSGGSCSEIVFTGMEETNSVIDVGLCIPDGITNVDVFASTNLMPDGFPWVLIATNLPVVTNSVVWSWTNVVETNVFLAAGDGTADTDGDGLTDAREFYVYGTEMSLWDTDGDLYSDGEELQWGTDPLEGYHMPPLGRGVVINEVLYNAIGDDANKEWVELFNNNRFPINLYGFYLQVATNAFDDVFMFPTGAVIESGDFLLVGGSLIINADYTVNLTMPNRGAGDRTAGVRLVATWESDHAVVDALLYAPDNYYNLPTDGFGTNGLAPYANSGNSLKRVWVGFDTDHASDWMYTNGPSPTGSGQLPDIDGDGLSNAMEISGYLTYYGYLYTGFDNRDSDGDGLWDGEEYTNQPPTHPLQYDSDGDQFPWWPDFGIYTGNDGDEVHDLGSDPTMADTDGDGLPDGWEGAMGYDPTDTMNGSADAEDDYDGDGISNIAEYWQNSNPMDPDDSGTNDFKMVLVQPPQGGWQSGLDMGYKTTAIYEFQNVLRTARVAVVVADGGYTPESFRVSWTNAIETGETGGRTNLVWATLLPGTVPRMIITDNGTTWSNQNPAHLGADLSVDILKVDLDIYDGQGGVEVDDDHEESVGAFTVANLNDTDGDGTTDKDDSNVTATSNGRNEIDLMQLVVRKPEPDVGDNVTLRVVSGDVKLWESPTKNTEVTLSSGEVEFPTTDLPQMFWVEVRAASASVRDIELEMEYKGCFDRVKATGIWAQKLSFRNSGNTLSADADGTGINATFADPDQFDSTLGLIDTPSLRRNGMELGFTVLPSGIGGESKVRFDITRQMENKAWKFVDGLREEIFQSGPGTEFPASFPVQDEQANDDSSSSVEDEDVVPNNDHIYSIDPTGPGFPNAFFDRLVIRFNFKEFVRVRVDGTDFSDDESIEGSRSSSKAEWRSRLDLLCNDGVCNGTTLYIRNPSGDNEVEEGHENLLPAP